MDKKPPMSEEERRNIKKSRAKSDKDLLVGGADVVPTGEQVLIVPTSE